MRVKSALLVLVAASVVAVVHGPSRDAWGQETPRMGGVLKVASIGEPPTLTRTWGA